MIKQSLNHQLESQVELRKILKYNPTQLYLFGFVAVLWILFMIVGLTVGTTQSLDGSSQALGLRRLVFSILTLLNTSLITLVLGKLSVRVKNIYWEIDSSGNILIAIQTIP